MAFRFLMTGGRDRAVLLSALLSVAMSGACAGEDERGSAGEPSNSSGFRPGTAVIGDGGAAAGGAAVGGSGGDGGGDRGGAGGEAMVPALDNACVGTFAFQAIGMSFSEPTAQPLALALSELAYSGDTHPLTVVIRSGPGQPGDIAASASLENASFEEAFLVGFAPKFAPVTVLQGGFFSAAPQLKGYVRLRDLDGPVQLELNNLNITAATRGDCASATITIDAVMPVSERDTALVLQSGATTVGALAGGEPAKGLQIRMMFAAVGVSFDFSSL